MAAPHWNTTACDVSVAVPTQAPLPRRDFFPDLSQMPPPPVERPLQDQLTEGVPRERELISSVSWHDEITKSGGVLSVPADSELAGHIARPPGVLDFKVVHSEELVVGDAFAIVAVNKGYEIARRMNPVKRQGCSNARELLYQRVKNRGLIDVIVAVCSTDRLVMLRIVERCQYSPLPIRSTDVLFALP